MNLTQESISSQRLFVDPLDPLLQLNWRRTSFECIPIKIYKSEAHWQILFSWILQNHI